MSESKRILLRKVECGASIVAIIMGIILVVGGNMLGVWIVGFACYGLYSSIRRLKASNERKRT